MRLPSLKTFYGAFLSVHAAVIVINDALDKQVADETLTALQNPAAHLNNIYTELSDTYQDVLYEAKETKAEIARNKVCFACEMWKLQL